MSGTRENMSAGLLDLAGLGQLKSLLCTGVRFDLVSHNGVTPSV